VERIPIQENERERNRLAALVDRLSDDDLTTSDADGWTVGVLLAHLAFWDGWADTIIHRWRTGEMPPPTVPGWYDDAMNATLLPTWRGLPPRVAGKLALDAAESVDRQVSRTETPVLAGIFAAHESHLIHRHLQRTACLDRIEAMLSGAS
jgi:hypothetical protein